MKSHEISVRAATLGDRLAVEGLWLELLREEAVVDSRFRPSDDAAERWRADYPVWLQDTTRLLAIAEADGEVLGFISAHLWGPEPILEQVVEVFVEYLYVRSEGRRQGVGSALVHAVSQWASPLGAVRMRLRALALSEDADAFWRARGAQPFATEMLLDLGEPRPRPPRSALGFHGNSA